MRAIGITPDAEDLEVRAQLLLRLAELCDLRETPQGKQEADPQAQAAHALAALVRQSVEHFRPNHFRAATKAS